MASNDQNTRVSNNNSNIDPKKVYSEVIQQLDEIRSHIDISSQDNVKLFNEALAEKEPDIAKLNSYVLKSSNMQESRAHAFYRLIGFPVISDPNGSSISFYNPGYDIVEPDSSYKYKIAAKQNIDLSKLSLFREHYYNSKIANIFSKNKSIDASVLSLMSTNIREKFNIFKSPGTLDTERRNQSYLPDDKNYYTPKQPKYTSYTDENGNVPTENLMFDRYHIVRPFIVDPRIELTVSPAKNRVCVPFIKNKSQSKLREGEYLRLPFIEKVIRDRFANFDYTRATAAYNIDEINAYSGNNKELNDRIAKNDLYAIDDTTRFHKYQDLIESMCKLLAECKDKIATTQSMYHWIPIPATNGPEGGCTTAAIYIKDDAKLNSPTDQEIINLQIKNTVNKMNINTVNSGTNDPGNFALSGISSFTNIDENPYVGDIVESELQKEYKIRNSICDSANEALKTIEIIMGEFSGLGLCDILAITGALYTVDRSVLLGFLDDKAFARLQKTQGFQGIESSLRPSIKDSLDKFTQEVSLFYDIMDNAYEEVLNKRKIES